MSSHFKIQGSFKGLLAAVAVAAVSLTSLQASAATTTVIRSIAPRGTPVVVRPPIVVPPAPVVVVPACKRGGPGITPC
jgi:hypothetical protein